jgi:formylglycine-generating enzyme required for sulfatase activity
MDNGPASQFLVLALSVAFPAMVWAGCQQRRRTCTCRNQCHRISPILRRRFHNVGIQGYAATAVAQTVATSPRKTKTPEGWVVIETKGQKFQFGQEFPGYRWTYTFQVHEVSFRYNFMMDSKQVTQEQYKPATGETPTLQ